MTCAACGALAGLGWTGPALAMALEVVVLPGARQLDANALTRAVTLEVERALAPAERDGARITLQVDAAQMLTVSYRDRGGAEVSRSVPSPARADELPETAALLAGNLVRDDATDLIGGLRAVAPAREVAAAEPRPDAGAQVDAPERLPHAAVNVSVFHPMSLLPEPEKRELAFELGLFYSRVGALSGVALTGGGVARVDGTGAGVLLGGLGFVHGGPGDGVRIGGVFGVGRDRFEGLDIAGAVNVQTAEYAGAQIAGATNVTGGDIDGAQISGVFNLAHAANGAQIAGASNVATEDLDGAQLSGALNVARAVNGLQISLINVGADVSGTQIGLVNVARDVRGLQLGLVNVAREVDGVSLGYVPYSSRGRTQAVAWYNSHQPFNVGVRFHTGVLYVMPTFGYDPGGSAFGEAGEPFSYAPGLSLGGRIAVAPAWLDVDVNASHPSERYGYEEHNIDLRYRLIAGVSLLRNVGVFAGGGVRHHIRTQGPVEQSVSPELSAGVELW